MSSPIDARAPVLVLGFHHGGLGIARSLGRLGVPVHAVHGDHDSPALSSRYCRSAHRWDFSRQGPARSVDFLLDLGRKLGSGTLLVPTSDHLALLVAEHADALSDHFRFQRQDPATVRMLSDKRELYYLCQRLSIPTAGTLFPQTRADVLHFLDEAVFPLMLKGIDGLRLEARTGKKMVIVHSAKELLAWYDRLEDPDRPNLMLQEYIPGGDDTIWMFNGYFDDDSECLLGFTGRKLRQHPIHTGSTSLGVVVQNERVVELTRRFMKAIGYHGILDIGYRFDARDGQYKLLDPNPRIGSTFRLFVGENGMDVVRCLYLHLTGQPVPASLPREGRKWLVEDQDLESALDYGREGSLTVASWIRSFQGVEEAAWFAWDDPAPAWRVGGALVRRGVRLGSARALGRDRTARPIRVLPAREPTH